MMEDFVKLVELHKPSQNLRYNRNAAVLIGIRESETDPGVPEVLLTRRALRLRSHPGEVSFPGGKQEPGETAFETALREAMEEVGLNAAEARPIGMLDQIVSKHGVLVSPVVAIIPQDFKPVINEDEVESAFFVPLTFFTSLTSSSAAALAPPLQIHWDRGSPQSTPSDISTPPVSKSNVARIVADSSDAQNEPRAAASAQFEMYDEHVCQELARSASAQDQTTAVCAPHASLPPPAALFVKRPQQATPVVIPRQVHAALEHCPHVSVEVNLFSLPAIVHVFRYHHHTGVDYTIWGLTANLLLRLCEVGLQYQPPYLVHHPSAPNWMQLSQLLTASPAAL